MCRRVCVDACAARGLVTTPANWGQTGSAMLMCTTRPSPKNVEMRALRAIEKLIRNHEIERRVLLLERADGAQGEDRSTPSV